jgi:hypothetical protein
VHQLPDDNRYNKQWDTNIRRDEIRRIPVPLEENGESDNQRDDGRSDEAKPRCVRLERALPRQRVARQALRPHSSMEAHEAETQRGPRNQARDGTEVDEPTERLRGTAGAE